MSNTNSLALIKITGEDAQSFLQGQLTNDVNAIKGQWQFSGLCNPKGRLVASFIVYQHQDSFNLIAQNDICEALVKRLTMYVLRSKVQIETPSSPISFTENQSNTSFIDADKTVKLVNENLELDLGFGKLIVHDSSDSDTQLTKETSDWLQHFTLNGIAMIHSANSEQFVPQTINLDLLNGVSFKKGCYSGQEIVARMHYLGKSKKRLFVCKTDTSSDPSQIQSTSKVYTSDDLAKGVGEIVSFWHDEQANCYLLVVLNLEDHPKVIYAENKTPISVLETQPVDLNPSN